MRLWIAMVLMGLCVVPALAEDVKPEAEAPSRFVGMDEAALKSEMKRLVSEITDLARRSRVIRERAMAQDAELRAMNQQIARIQEKIRVTLAEKYPTLSSLESQKSEAIEEHGAAAAALRERKMTEAEKAGEQ